MFCTYAYVFKYIGFNINMTIFELQRIYDGVEGDTRKLKAMFQIIEVSSEALPRMRLE